MISKPYLRLRDRISQVWLNKYTIALVLVALKLILFHKSIDNSLKTSQNYTLDSCPTIDSYTSNAISLPHYLSKSANYMIVKSVEEMNKLTLETLKTLITASEEVIIFAINMVVGTYACVLVSTIDGAVDVAINGTETIISYVNNTLGTITDDIELGLDDVSNVINKIIDKAEKIESFFSGDSTNDTSLNAVNLTVNGLRNLYIPSGINTKLQDLKENVPDFTTIENKTEYLIKEPFELIKEKIGNVTVFSDDFDDLYVPQINQVTICSGNSDKINKFYSTISKDLRITVKVFVALLIVAATLVTIPLIYHEWRSWKKLKILEKKLIATNKSHSNEKLGDSSLHGDISVDPIDAFDQTFNKYVTCFGMFIARKSSGKVETQIRIRWLLSYILSQRAIILLSLSLLGFFTVFAQWIILSSVTRAVNDHDSPFKNITNEISTEFNASVTNWTISTNEYLSSKESDINDELFGWVQTGTESINSTISTIVDDLNDVISDAFNGTILYDPVKTIVGCVITNKLIKIEEGLSWLQNKSHVSLPRVNDSYLTEAFKDTSSSNITTYNNYTNTSELISKRDDSDSSDQIISKAKDMIESVETLMKSMLKTTLKEYQNSLKFELWVSLAMLVIWGIQLLIGLLLLYLDHCRFSNAKIPKNYSPKDLSISYPKTLTNDEKLRYGYPFTMPFEKETSDENHCDSKITLCEKMQSNTNDPFIENPFDESESITDDSFSMKSNSPAYQSSEKSKVTELVVPSNLANRLD
ncbi:hypothetical protein WICMUC_003402 [Wickerhamomyces mucosus]|uniref:Plasma membrane fusion protein PRM1 n=1 Tax=Wickerhamomyces mucosus TaxID=1378264 RepID=A0A9P8TDB1_9ASCO|nr:hypothetical protein WICMUC_003402 [Wickerhamomyces mucosus]